MNTNLQHYDALRANEFENVYKKADRAGDLNTLSLIVQNIFRNKQVFEIGCGTGYWTEQIAKTAKSVFATDYNAEVLELARQKKYSNASVEFAELDFYQYDPPVKHESLFGGFIWSYIPLQELAFFLQKMSSYVKPGGSIVFVDNNYVEGSSTPISELDIYYNSYQSRVLVDGSTHRLLKNYPKEAFIRNQVGTIAKDIEIIQLKYFWLLRFTVPAI